MTHTEEWLFAVLHRDKVPEFRGAHMFDTAYSGPEQRMQRRRVQEPGRKTSYSYMQPQDTALAA